MRGSSDIKTSPGPAACVTPTDATIDEIVAATGWLPHTARAALTGLRKRGYAIASDRCGPAPKARWTRRRPRPSAGAIEGRRRAFAAGPRICAQHGLSNDERKLLAVPKSFRGSWGHARPWRAFRAFSQSRDQSSRWVALVHVAAGGSADAMDDADGAGSEGASLVLAAMSSALARAAISASLSSRSGRAAPCVEDLPLL